MATKATRYDEEFKKSLIALCNNGKTQTSVCQEYGVSPTALARRNISDFNGANVDFCKISIALVDL